MNILSYTNPSKHLDRSCFPIFLAAFILRLINIGNASFGVDEAWKSLAAFQARPADTIAIAFQHASTNPPRFLITSLNTELKGVINTHPHKLVFSGTCNLNGK